MRKIIETVEYFKCGYCVNRIENLFRGVKAEVRRFQAGVFLIKHQRFGYILYDTGYGTELNRSKLKYWLYRKANPTYITAQTEIGYQLSQRGINPKQIRYVILSHLHPDHIGGAKAFPNARFIITKDLAAELDKFKLRDLVFTELLPKDFKKRLWVVEPNKVREDFGYRKSYDLFGDGSLLVCSFDGHAKGQLGLYIAEWEIMLASDVCWGMDLLSYNHLIKAIPLLIQNNDEEYFKSINAIRKMQRDGIRVLVSHDNPARIKACLNKKS